MPAVRGRFHGAADDLERASELCRQIVTRYAMSGSLGPLTYGIPHEARFLRTPFASEERNYSERTSEQIDEAVRRILEHIHEQVRAMLTGRREDLDRIATILIEKETLYREELDELLSPHEEHQPA